jgi:hypothetical protein
MNLIEYIKTHDESAEWRLKVCESDKITFEQYISEGYCPSNFTCLKDTQFYNPYSPYKHDKYDCKYIHTINNKKCKECWNREIEDEYTQYLKLRGKFEK